MFYPPELLTWVEEVSTHLPHLSKTQAQMLAWYSFAVTIVQSSGLSHVSVFLAHLLGRSEETVRQRLRESLYDAVDKRGHNRREVDVVLCFAPLLQWIVSRWSSPDERLFLALDATTLRQTFTVLSVSVLVGHCAIPIAWTILPANQPGRWRPHWLGLLQAVQLDIPQMQIMVAADRGLYAKWLFEAIVVCGWHPLMRINDQGNCWLRSNGKRLRMSQLATLCKGHYWQGEVLCFSGQDRLACTLIVVWDDRQQAAWLLLTDCPPAHVSPAWYALRMWVEAGFKALKSAAFHWERTRMTDPARAERLWLVLSLACLRAALLAPPIQASASSAPYPRLNLFKQGILRQLALLIRLQPLPTFHLPQLVLPPSPCLDFLCLLKTYP
jgi:hypothetical protein